LDFLQLCSNAGIRRQLTNTDTLEQNKVVERANKKLLEIVKSMSIFTSMPQFLWTEAINIAAFFINRSPTIVNPQITPF